MTFRCIWLVGLKKMTFRWCIWLVGLKKMTFKCIWFVGLKKTWGDFKEDDF